MLVSHRGASSTESVTFSAIGLRLLKSLFGRSRPSGSDIGEPFPLVKCSVMLFEPCLRFFSGPTGLFDSCMRSLPCTFVGSVFPVEVGCLATMFLVHKRTATPRLANCIAAVNV